MQIEFVMMMMMMIRFYLQGQFLDFLKAAHKEPVENVRWKSDISARN